MDEIDAASPARVELSLLHLHLGSAPSTYASHDNVKYAPLLAPLFPFLHCRRHIYSLLRSPCPGGSRL